MGSRGQKSSSSKIKKLTIKEQAKRIEDKYKQDGYIKHVDYYRTRDFDTSGAGTGKGSKGTKYKYTYYTTFYRKGNTLGLELSASNLEELEKKIKAEIKKEVK